MYLRDLSHLSPPLPSPVSGEPQHMRQVPRALQPRDTLVRRITPWTTAHLRSSLQLQQRQARPGLACVRSADRPLPKSPGRRTFRAVCVARMLSCLNFWGPIWGPGFTLEGSIDSHVSALPMQRRVPTSTVSPTPRRPSTRTLLQQLSHFQRISVCLALSGGWRVLQQLTLSLRLWPAYGRSLLGG
jgi:hypothetical protein